MKYSNLILALILFLISMMELGAKEPSKRELLDKYENKNTEVKSRANKAPRLREGDVVLPRLTKGQINDIFEMKDSRIVVPIGDELETYLNYLMRGVEKNLYRAGRLEADGYPDKAAEYIENTAMPNMIYMTDAFRNALPDLVWRSGELLDEMNYWRIEMWLSAGKGERLKASELRWFDKFGGKAQIEYETELLERAKDSRRSKGSYVRVNMHCVGCHQQYSFD